MIQNFLQSKYQSHLQDPEKISLSLSKDENGFWLTTRIGTTKKAHEFAFVSSDLTHELLIEYLDGVLEEFFEANRDAYLPLDFTQRTFDNKTLWVKHELRDFEAEDLAKKWLELS